LRWDSGGWSTNYKDGHTSWKLPFWRPTQVQIPAKVQAQQAWQPNLVTTHVPQTSYVSEVVTEKVPVQTVRYVQETVVRKIPVQVCRMVAETQQRVTPVTTYKPVTERVENKVEVKVCKMVAETQERRIPYQVHKNVYETATRQVPVRVCRKVAEQRIERVTKCVPKWTAYVETYRVPHLRAVCISGCASAVMASPSPGAVIQPQADPNIHVGPATVQPSLKVGQEVEAKKPAEEAEAEKPAAEPTEVPPVKEEPAPEGAVQGPNLGVGLSQPASQRPYPRDPRGKIVKPLVPVIFNDNET